MQFNFLFSLNIIHVMIDPSVAVNIHKEETEQINGSTL
jgi:hypothetical protein